MAESQVGTTYVSRLTIRNFRSYERLDLALDPGVTVVLGPNGSGKTNVLEAIAFGCTGSSPRTASELDCIRETSDTTTLQIAARRDDIQLRHHGVTLAMGRGKRLTLDEKPVSAPEYSADIPVVTFLPERLLVVRGAPARRRQLLDTFVSRLSVGAADVARGYSRALAQRNALVRRARSSRVDPEEVAPWTAQLLQFGNELRGSRAAALDAVQPWYARRVHDLTGFGDASIHIEPRGADLAAALAASWSDDVRRGSTCVGPHLDDVSLRVDGRDMRRRGSTGEQRAALLAWSLATYDAMVHETGIAPVVILDEPWSELDRGRREQLSDTVGALPQVITSTTEPPTGISASATLLAVSSGSVTPWTPTTP